MLAPHANKKAIEPFRKQSSRSKIRVKSHLRRTRKVSKSIKSTIKLHQGDVPTNDPKLAESLQLVSKMQFDDLMMYRQIVFYKNKN
jgi:hypothetical protein